MFFKESLPEKGEHSFYQINFQGQFVATAAGHSSVDLEPGTINVFEEIFSARSTQSSG